MSISTRTTRGFLILVVTAVAFVAVSAAEARTMPVRKASPAQRAVGTVYCLTATGDHIVVGCKNGHRGVRVLFRYLFSARDNATLKVLPPINCPTVFSGLIAVGCDPGVTTVAGTLGDAVAMAD